MAAANVKTEVDKNMLIMKVDLSKDQGLSKSGKSTVIGTTGGAVTVTGKNGEAVKVNLTVYK